MSRNVLTTFLQLRLPEHCSMIPADLAALPTRSTSRLVVPSVRRPHTQFVAVPFPPWTPLRLAVTR